MNRIVMALALAALVGCRKDTARMDLDNDGTTEADGDCGPGDPLVGPGQVEICDGRDNDCNETIDDGVGSAWFSDGDGDGFGGDSAITACLPPSGSVAQDGDCDDANPAVHPGAREVCDDTEDFDCDGTPGGVDADGDGAAACDDCDDDDADAHPGAEEVCGGGDEDCDGEEDLGATDAKVYYVDLDDDGHGSDRVSVEACEAPNGFVEDADDCDDLHAQSFPGSPEACDGLDNDCDGTPDDGANGTRTWYLDSDADGFGDKTTSLRACAPPAGYSEFDSDCDDTNAKFNPAATESCSDPTDYNCDGSVGQADGDNDGTPACTDCDDGNASVEPGANEVCDALDNDCNGQIDEAAPTWYADVDGDGHGGKQMSAVSCIQPSGYVSSSDDCDDLVATVLPGTAEACNGVDDDCTGGVPTNEADADTDGVRVCGGDCDDGNNTVRPGAVETCDTKDNDCDGTPDDAAVDAKAVYTDTDGDGFGTGSATYACNVTSGKSAVAGDCNDADNAAKPGAVEACNTKDDDCDGAVDESGATGGTKYHLDADGDGVGGSKVFVTACAAPAGYVVTATDCDDTDKTSYPGATEACDGVDNDCASGVPANEADTDRDGWRGCIGDCNDAVAAVFPGATELCNSRDDDCNSVLDDNAADALTFFADTDNDKYGNAASSKIACTAPTGYVAIGGDCDDTKVAISPVSPELCSTANVDDDCDGAKDEADAQDAKVWYQDADADLHGTPSNFSLACTQPSGRVALGDDCNDTNNKIYTGATDIPGNGIDEDCSGADKTARTCKEILAAVPTSANGVYTIDTDGLSGPHPTRQTYCDMSGGGWTMLGKSDTRSTPLTAAERDIIRGTGSGTNGTFAMYGTTGYGDPATSSRIFFLPLDSWNDLTAAYPSNVFRELDSSYDIRLTNLAIGTAAARYPLNYAGVVPSYQDMVGSALKGMMFTTWDNDNDVWPSNCARDNVGYNGGMWYQSCYQISMLHANGNLYSWQNNVGTTTTFIELWFREN